MSTFTFFSSRMVTVLLDFWRIRLEVHWQRSFSPCARLGIMYLDPRDTEFYDRLLTLQWKPNR